MRSASGFCVVPGITVILGFVTAFASKSSSLLFLGLKDTFTIYNLKIKPKEFMIKHSAFINGKEFKTLQLSHVLFITHKCKKVWE